MNKYFYGILMIVLLIIVGLGIIVSDPFLELPKGTSPNCGPESRYKFDVTINSKDDFVNFIKITK